MIRLEQRLWPLAAIGLALAIATAQGPRLIAESSDGDPSPPSGMSGKGKGGGGKGKGKRSGMGKGKGKGKGRSMQDDSPSSSAASVTNLDAEEVKFFETKIEPVLEEQCYRCHGEDGKTKGGLALTSANELLAGGDSGPAIVPGEVDRSLLITSIKWEDEELEMPPKKQLPREVVVDFEEWIAMGAPDPRVTTSASAPGGAPPDGGVYGTITGIFNDEVIFSKSSSGGGRGGKGRRGGGSEAAYPVANNLVVTTGTIARRTSAFQQGMELGGGLENSIFKDLEGGGLRARIVIDEETNRITEINVIVSDATMEEGIAVRPKRPPMKTEVGR